MRSYSSIVEVSDAAHGWTRVRVQTKKTWYIVVVEKEEVTILAPGLKISAERDDDEGLNIFGADMGHEFVALMHVIKFEGESE